MMKADSMIGVPSQVGRGFRGSCAAEPLRGSEPGIRAAISDRDSTVPARVSHEGIVAEMLVVDIVGVREYSE